MSHFLDSTSSLVIPGLASKRGWKKATRVSRDDPSPLIVEVGDEHDSSSSSVPSNGTCSVCHKHQSRYTCPRCDCPYCSVDCYRNHTAVSNKEGNTNSSPCSEIFFKNRVSSALELEAKEHKGNTEKMIQDHYRKLRTEQEEEEDLSEQLYDLLHLLEERKDEELTQQKILEMMPNNLRVQFERDVQNGKLYEGVVENWHPWWRRQLIGAEGAEEVAATAIHLKPKTLDERLLRVPQFASMCRKAQAPELLKSNLLEILYSFCWTMRLFHGLGNITNDAEETKDGSPATIEAAESFLQNSSVLSQDARFSSMEEALLSSTSASTKSFPESCNSHWTTLVEDCAHILSSHRLVGRALFEAGDILKAAIHQLKTEDSIPPNKDTITKLWRLRKKLDFYLSWSQSSKNEFGEHAKTKLMDWVQEWDSSRDDSNLRKGEFQFKT